jgi:hypothetical protein
LIGPPDAAMTNFCGTLNFCCIAISSGGSYVSLLPLLRLPVVESSEVCFASVYGAFGSLHPQHAIAHAQEAGASAEDGA